MSIYYYYAMLALAMLVTSSYIMLKTLCLPRGLCACVMEICIASSSTSESDADSNASPPTILNPLKPPCQQVLLCQPSSAAVERVFSLLNNSFNDQQSRALEDYDELALLLQHKKKT